jgi:hypothetical protein
MIAIFFIGHSPSGREEFRSASGRAILARCQVKPGVRGGVGCTDHGCATSKKLAPKLAPNNLVRSGISWDSRCGETYLNSCHHEQNAILLDKEDAASRIAKPLYPSKANRGFESLRRRQAQSLNVAQTSLRRFCLRFLEAHWYESLDAPRSFFTAWLSYLRIDYRGVSARFLDWVCPGLLRQTL